MTDKEFCYWLQGYFEIATRSSLDKNKLILIESMLNKINEPYGEFTRWLQDVLFTLKSNQYHLPLIEFFQNKIRSELNGIFLHVIDQSYETTLTQKELANIHYGNNAE
ncbi:MAG: hypothetical protein ACYCQI_14145 [Gammaproteobacteria bacterium]